ncbi:MAG: cyclopropane-fatty-acyl-phospholipid synthase family protein [Paracoccaceae bacterium]
MWEGLMLGLMRKAVTDGRLTVTMPDGQVHVFGDGTGDAPQVAIRITDPDLPRKLALNPDLALGEAYMDGRLIIENEDVVGLMQLAARAVDHHRLPLLNRLHERGREVFRRALQWNPVGRSRRNVAHHYDLSEEFYTLFLDENRQYTCAYWREDGMTLEQAQLAKMDHIARKLLLKPGMTVLDIGSGFGTLAIHLARNYGVNVTGVTLSQTQIDAARARAHAEGLSDRVTFRFQDYREVPETFDRIVSVGMMEHVGVPQYGKYFGQISRRLAAEGVALIHTIGRSSPPTVLSPWFNKYIFPGGYSPALSEVMPSVQKNGLVLADCEVWRGHYERTLREWRRRFEANLPRVRQVYDERLVRMWRYYLIGAELSFTEYHNVVFQLQLSKQPLSVPMTRDYLYRS